MSHYLLYARVSPKGSTWAAEETSIADQLRDGRAYVLSRDPQATFTEAYDEFATADHARMPAFTRALGDLRSDRAPWAAIVFRHIDRVGRSAVEVIQFGAELAARGKYFVAYAMPFPTEPPVGPLILGIFALLAEFERRMISERTRTRMVGIAKAGGIPYGTPPYGYRRSAPHENRLIPDPDRASRVLDLYRRYADGAGFAELSRASGLTRQTLLNLLRRRTYLGIVTYAGIEYPGSHPPIVPLDLWQRVQQRLPAVAASGAPSPRPRAAIRPFPLSGLVRCTCGRWLTAASAHGRSAIYRYYQCTDVDGCRRRYPADQLETQVFAALRQLPLRPIVIQEAIRRFQTRLCDQLSRQTDATEIRRLESDRLTFQRRHQRLLDAIESGLLTPDNAGDLNRRLTEARAALDDADRRLALLRSLSNPDPATLADCAAWARAFRDVASALKDGKSEALTVVLRGIIERIDLLPDDDSDETSAGPGPSGPPPRPPRPASPRWRLTLRLAGSPNGIEWLRTFSVHEPLPLFTCGSITVLVRLVAA